MTNALHILKAAGSDIKDRSSTRDHAGKKSMDKTIALFNLRTDQTLTVREGWIFMQCVKQSRASQGKYNLDDYVDEVAYGALAAEAAEDEANPSRNVPEMQERKDGGRCLPSLWQQIQKEQGNILDLLRL